MKDFAKSIRTGNVKAGNALPQEYHKRYPSDSIYADMKPSAQLESIKKEPWKVYDIMGVGDSIARENVFDMIEEKYGIEYNDIYEAWLGKSWNKVVQKKSGEEAKRLAQKLGIRFGNSKVGNGSGSWKGNSYEDSNGNSATVMKTGGGYTVFWEDYRGIGKRIGIYKDERTAKEVAESAVETEMPDKIKSKYARFENSKIGNREYTTDDFKSIKEKAQRIADTTSDESKKKRALEIVDRMRTAPIQPNWEKQVEYYEQELKKIGNAGEGFYQLTGAKSGPAKYKAGQTVKTRDGQGTVIKVQPMKMSATPTYKIKLDSGKEVWAYEEEIKVGNSKVGNYTPNYRYKGFLISNPEGNQWTVYLKDGLTVAHEARSKSMAEDWCDWHDPKTNKPLSKGNNIGNESINAQEWSMFKGLAKDAQKEISNGNADKVDNLMRARNAMNKKVGNLDHVEEGDYVSVRHQGEIVDGVVRKIQGTQALVTIDGTDMWFPIRSLKEL